MRPELSGGEAAAEPADRAEEIGLRRLAWPSRPTAAIIAILLLATAVRLSNLGGRSLWLDEIFTAQAANLGGLNDLIGWCQSQVNQMPFFYLFSWLIGRWGDSEALLRLPAAIAGILTVLAVYWLGCRLLGSHGGLIAALLTSLMPFAVWYSQEARPYSLFMLVTTFQMYCAYNAVKRGRARDWAGLTGFTILNLYTHYLALAPTAAVIVYVSIFMLRDLLGDASNRIKGVAAAVALAAAGGAVAVPWRSVLRVLYRVAVSVLQSAQLHRAVALTVLVAAASVLGLLIALLARRSTKLRRFTLALGAGAAVLLAYSPWLSFLHAFLSQPDQSIGRLNPKQGLDLAELTNLLGWLGLTGVLLAALCLGLVAVSAWLFRGRAAEAALLLCWAGVPLLLFWLSVRWSITSIDSRYLSFLFPAAMLLIAAGLIASAATIAVALRWLRLGASRTTLSLPAVARLILVAVLLAQALPALAVSLGQPKVDYRAAAAHIAASSPPGSTVLAVGTYSDWVVLCLDYYLHQMHSPVSVADATQLNSDDAARLAGGNGTVWGVVIFPSPAQLDLLSQRSEEKTDFIDVTGTIHVLRAAAGGRSPAAQAMTLLRWESPLQPQLNAAVKLLDVLAGGAFEGPSLVAEPSADTQSTGGWGLDASVRVVGTTLVLAPTQSKPEVNAFFTVVASPGEDYAVSFDHRSVALDGWQRVYALAVDSGGHPTIAFPDGKGYECKPLRSWNRSAFAVHVPPGTTALTLVLRAHGRGVAEFRAVQVNRI